MCMARPLNVGIVGLSAGGGWAGTAHVPALRHLPDFHLAGLVASSTASSRAAADLYGVDLVFDDASAMAESDDIDMVVVTVKVPQHRDAILPALKAGKIVLCEWPLAVNLAEAEELAGLAAAPAFVGLQARATPAVRYLRDLVADGHVGDVLSTSVIGTGGNWGARVEPRNSYTLDSSSGATMLTIPFGHAVDAMTMVLGEFADLRATLATRRSRVVEVGTDRTLPVTAPDQVAVTGQLSGGAVASVHYRGGTSTGTNFMWEINGTEGDIVITADSGHIQMAPLTIRASRRGEALAELSVPARYRPLDESFAVEHPRAYNVACAYVRMMDDLRAGSRETPTFDHALARHRFLHAVQLAA
jgi:predicted dehydrogenase